jgi:hypothetical protein
MTAKKGTSDFGESGGKVRYVTKVISNYDGKGQAGQAVSGQIIPPHGGTAVVRPSENNSTPAGNGNRKGK